MAMAAGDMTKPWSCSTGRNACNRNLHVEAVSLGEYRSAVALPALGLV
jgi:hypothetical protein